LGIPVLPDLEMLFVLPGIEGRVVDGGLIERDVKDLKPGDSTDSRQIFRESTQVPGLHPALGTPWLREMLFFRTNL
jgi:hypothetical protein